MPGRLNWPAVALLAALLPATIAQAAPVPEDCESLSNSDPQRAHALAEAMLSVSPLSPPVEAAARMCLAWSHVRTGAADQARAEAERLLVLAREAGLPPEQATAALRRVGSVGHSLGDRSGAVERYVEALAIAEAHGLAAERIGLLINMGVVRGELLEDKGAHVHFEEALRLIESTGNRQYEAPLLNNYGLSLIVNGEPERGLPLLERALVLAETGGHRVGIAHITHSLGHAHRQLGNFEQAEAMLQRALAERRAIGARAGEAATLLEMARVYRATDRLQQALAGAEEATALAGQTGDEKSQREGHLLLSLLYEQLGRTGEALAAAREHARMEQEFLREQNLQRLAEFEARQQGLLGQRELELLRRDNEIQALQLTSDQAMRQMGLYIALLLLVIGLAVTTHLRRVNRRLRRSNAIDDLTGLSNRRYMTKILDWARDRYLSNARTGTVREGVLFLIDLDYFKNINDQYGHAGGDYALRVIAQRLQGVSRGDDDRVARWGGEEFLVVARGLDIDQACAMAERLRRVIGDSPVRLPDGRSMTVTGSIGFAPWPFFEGGPALAWQDAMRMADRALYAAKSAGRDAWLGVWGRTPPPEGLIDSLHAEIDQAEAAGQVRVVASRQPPAGSGGLDAGRLDPVGVRDPLSVAMTSA